MIENMEKLVRDVVLKIGWGNQVGCNSWSSSGWEMSGITYKDKNNEKYLTVEVNSDKPNNYIVYNCSKKEIFHKEWDSFLDLCTPYYNIDLEKVIFLDDKFLKYYEYNDNNRFEIIDKIIEENHEYIKSLFH